MSEPTANFAVALQDEISGTARSAAGALQQLKAKIDEDTKALREMRRAMRNLKGGTSVSAEAFKDLRAQIDAKRASIAGAQARMLEMGGSFGKTEPKVKSFLETVAETQGPIGTLGTKLTSLKKMLKAPVVAALALGAGLLALGAAAVKATIALGKAAVGLVQYGLAQANARRSEALRLEGLNMLSQSYGRSTASVADLQAAIDRASDSTNIGRDTLAGYGRQLARFGVRGGALADAVEVMGMASMVHGERGARQFMRMARNAQLTGRSVREVAESYRRRLGPIAGREMAELGNQWERFKRSIAQLFSGIRLDRFLDAIKKLGDQFSQSTVTGQALKQLVESIFQPMIDDATEGVPLLVRLFQSAVLGALRFRTMLLNIENRFLRLRIAIAETQLRIASFFSFGEEAGSDIAAGVRKGVTDGAAASARASRQMADRIRSTFANSLQIRSPSRVFAKFGGHIAGGLTQGMQRGVAGAARSARSLAQGVAGAFDAASPSVSVTPAPNLAPTLPVETAEATPIGNGDQGTSTSSVSVSIGEVHVMTPEGERDPRAFAATFREELGRVLSGLSLELGAGVT